MCEFLIVLCLEGAKHAESGADRDYPSGYCDKKLYSISKEVKLLEARLHFLASEEGSGQIAKRRTRNRAQPISRLPDEVLGNIVLFSMTSRDALIWRSPALAVSNRWRNCALGELRIWQNVYIVSDTKEDELVTWLSRSRSAPLHIYCALPKTSDYSQDEHFDCMQSLLTPHSLRIRSLVYDIGVLTDDVFPLSLRMPSLWNLSVKWQEDPSTTSPPDVFQHEAPSGLRELHLDSRIVAPNQVVLNDFDASKLVGLSVTEVVTVPSIWSTLSRSTLLRQLRWYGNDNKNDTEPLDVSALESTRVTLQHLRSLEVNGTICCPILEHMDAPALRWLEICDTPTALQTIIPHILRRDQLRSLALWDVGSLEAHQIQDIFETCLQLEYFIHNRWTEESIPALESLAPPTSRRKSGLYSGPSLLALQIKSPLLSESDSNDDVDPSLRQNLIDVMKEYIRPLLIRRKRAALQPLTVVLGHSKLLDNVFLGVEGIQWDNDYSWPTEDELS